MKLLFTYIFTLLVQAIVAQNDSIKSSFPTHSNNTQASILEQYVMEGLNNNLALLQRNLEYSKSIENLKQARALFLPKITASSDYTLAQGGRSFDLSVNDMLSPELQPLLQALKDANLSLFRDNSIQLLPNNFHETKVRLIQPLFNTDVFYNYKAQKHLISMEDAKRNVFINELTNDIKVAYFQYMQATDGIKIYESGIVTLKELVRLNKSLVVNGIRTKDYIYKAEYELSRIEMEIVEIRKQQELSKAYFNFLLNRDLEADIIEESNTQNNVHAEALEESIALALQNRQELAQMQSAIFATKNLYQLNKANRWVPTAAVVTDAGYQGDAYKFTAKEEFWLVQLKMKWDAFNGGAKKASMQKAKIDMEILESKSLELKQQITLQTINAYNNYLAAQNMLELSKISLKSAKQSFDIIAKQYNKNTVILIEYLEAQNKYTKAQIDVSIAKKNLSINQTELEKVIANSQ